MGHALTHHDGKCYHFHGHNYTLEATVRGGVDDRTGMVMDFGDLKTLIKGILDRDYDHKFLIHWDDPRAHELSVLDPEGVRLVLFQPTAENLAKTIKWWIQNDLLELGLSTKQVKVTRVKLWETSNAHVEV